jgi:hypothetical protein
MVGPSVACTWWAGPLSSAMRAGDESASGAVLGTEARNCSDILGKCHKEEGSWTTDHLFSTDPKETSIYQVIVCVQNRIAAISCLAYTKQ